MRTTTALLVGGIACLALAVVGSMSGLPGWPWSVLALLGLAAVLLVAGILTARRGHDVEPPAGPARGERLVRPVTVGLGVLGAATTIVALTVPVGEARGHASAHLATGLVCLALFGALAFPWRPAPGSGAAAIRGLVLLLLAVAAAGSFAESMGGAGYDAANEARRIEALARLHGVALPFSGLAVVAVPLALLTGSVVLVARLVNVRRAAGA